MNLLLLGAGGREHALAWKIAQSNHCDHLYIAPGNAGTAKYGTNVALSLSDFTAIKEICLAKNIGLVIVGPEEPLVQGIVNRFLEDESVKHIPVLGPSREAARLEGSKSFAKKFMTRHGIPTAAYREFDESNFQEGIPYLQAQKLPIVLKADGLAAGKGVIICQSHIEAMSEFELMLHQSKFGEAGKKVVVEEFLEGIEMSVFILTDGKNYVTLPSAKDYKRIGEGDTGANTGGMGAVSPVPFADQAFMEKIKHRIIIPTIEGLQADNIVYKGFIFAGIIKVGDDPIVIEYNCRLGDPETEVIIPRLKNDLVDLFLAAAKGGLEKVTVEEDDRVACTVMAVSGGYPAHYEIGYPIAGHEREFPNSMVFHSGTTDKGGETVTSGGRVLCVTSYGNSVEKAVADSVAALEKITFEDMFFRRDIGYEFR